MNSMQSEMRPIMRDAMISRGNQLQSRANWILWPSTLPNTRERPHACRQTNDYVLRASRDNILCTPVLFCRCESQSATRRYSVAHTWILTRRISHFFFASGPMPELASTEASFHYYMMLSAARMTLMPSSACCLGKVLKRC